MYFLYESKAINWIPSEKQLDAFPISYMVRMKVDEIMEATTGSSEDKQIFLNLHPYLRVEMKVFGFT